MERSVVLRQQKSRNDPLSDQASSCYFADLVDCEKYLYLRCKSTNFIQFVWRLSLHCLPRWSMQSRTNGQGSFQVLKKVEHATKDKSKRLESSTDSSKMTKRPHNYQFLFLVFWSSQPWTFFQVYRQALDVVEQEPYKRPKLSQTRKKTALGVVPAGPPNSLGGSPWEGFSFFVFSTSSTASPTTSKEALPKFKGGQRMPKEGGPGAEE